MIHSGHHFLYHRSPGNTLRRSLYGAALALLLSPSTAAPVEAQTTFGWIPKKTNRNLGNGSDYDWGHLTATYTDTVPGNSSLTLYMGEDYSGYSDILDLGVFINGVTVNITGKSLFRWVWTPPQNPIDGFIYNDPTLQPNDPGQPFPPPAFYVVRWNAPHISVSPYTDRTFATGLVTDGFDPNWGPVLATPVSDEAPPDSLDIFGDFTGELPRIQVTQATLEADNQTGDINLAPTLSLNFYPGYPGDGSEGEWDLVASAYPIQLGSPNPFVRPDLGDGQNQFVIDPTGLLAVPALIPGFAQPGQKPLSYYGAIIAQWLLQPNTGGPLPPTPTPQVSITPQLMQYTNGKGPMAVPVTPNDYTLQLDTLGDIVPSTTDKKGHPALLFSGLPELPTQFGNYTMTLGVTTYDPVAKKATANTSQKAYY